MAGQHGISELKKIVLLGIEAANVISKVINKKGVFVAFDLVDELSALGGLNVEQVKKEIAELDVADREELKKVIKEKLVLVNPAVEAKIESGLDIVDEAVAQVVQIIGLVQRSIALFQ